MIDVPNFLVCPPIRCYQVIDQAPAHICGQDAFLWRHGSDSSSSGYFCKSHAQQDDQAIPNDRLIHRISVCCELVISGVSWRPIIAEAEALGRLEGACQRAGALLNVLTLTSVVGRYVVPARPQERPRWRP